MSAGWTGPTTVVFHFSPRAAKRGFTAARRRSRFLDILMEVSCVCRRRPARVYTIVVPILPVLPLLPTRSPERLIVARDIVTVISRARSTASIKLIYVRENVTRDGARSLVLVLYTIHGQRATLFSYFVESAHAEQRGTCFFFFYRRSSFLHFKQ